MSKHTPEPWTFEEWLGDPEPLRAVGLEPTPNVSNDGARYIMAGERRIALVDCQTKFKRGQGHRVVCAERDANARLIAAAPGLLDALKEALAFVAVWGAHYQCEHGLGDIHPKHAESLAKVQAVIAKAEGRK